MEAGMLSELYRTGQQLLFMIGMVTLLWGTFLMIGAMATNKQLIDYVKGAALLLFGVYLVGLGRTL
jgi:hypothetical protein